MPEFGDTYFVCSTAREKAERISQSRKADKGVSCLVEQSRPRRDSKNQNEERELVVSVNTARDPISIDTLQFPLAPGSPEVR